MQLVRRFLPSFPAGLAVALLLALLAQPWRTMMVASDGDACMHWRVGEWMLQHRQIIRADVFSHTLVGQPVISKEWLAEILFALAGRAGGLYGLAVVAAIVIAATFWILYRQLLRDDGDFLAATAVMLLAIGASWTHWLARPHVFSFLLLALWNGALRRHETTRRPVPLAVTLALLTVLWANLHGAFLAGFVVLGAYWLGALLERDPAKLRVLTGVGALCAVASLVNPSGWRLAAHNLAFLNSDLVTNYLKEYASPDFHSVEARGLLLWLAALLVALAVARPQLPVRDGVLLVVWTYFGLFAVRNVPLMVIVTAPILATALSAALPVGWREMSSRLRVVNDAGHGWLWAVPAALIAVGHAPRPTTMPASDWPVAAVKFVRECPRQFNGRLFNSYTWGGYLLWELPEHPVFVDGRTDFYGESLIDSFRMIMNVQLSWQRKLDKHQIGWTLLPAAHPLNQALTLLPGWACVYRDDVAMIFVRLK